MYIGFNRLPSLRPFSQNIESAAGVYFHTAENSAEIYARVDVYFAKVGYIAVVPSAAVKKYFARAADITGRGMSENYALFAFRKHVPLNETPVVNELFARRVFGSFLVPSERNGNPA